MTSEYVDRRKHNFRKTASDDMIRLRNTSDNRTTTTSEPLGNPSSEAVLNLRRRNGWHGVRTCKGSVMMFYLANQGPGRQTYFLELEPYRVRLENSLEYLFGDWFELTENIKI